MNDADIMPMVPALVQGGPNSAHDISLAVLMRIARISAAWSDPITSSVFADIGEQPVHCPQFDVMRFPGNLGYGVAHQDHP